MTVLELKIKLEELIAKGGAEYKVFTDEEESDEGDDGESYAYIYEIEARDIEVIEGNVKLIP